MKYIYLYQDLRYKFNILNIPRTYFFPVIMLISKIYTLREVVTIRYNY